MNVQEWHVDPDDLAAYRDRSLVGVAADSVEAHLVRCAACRQALAATAAPDDRGWERVAGVIDRPSGWHARSTWVRLAFGTPDLVVAGLGLLALLVALPLAVAIGNPRAAVTWFLALAPAVPVAGAVLAYRDRSDPAGDIAGATPMHSFRIVLVRALVVLLAVVPIGVLMSVALPVRTASLLGWILPCVACCSVVLAVGTRWNPTVVGATLAAGWAVAVFVGAERARHLPVGRALRHLAVNQPAAQVAFLLVAVAASIMFAVRRDDVTYHPTGWPPQAHAGGSAS
jgi:hypothetical protein